MKTIYELCKPRKSVADGVDRNDVLDLSDLRDGTINGEEFFAQTYMTSGLEQILDIAFQRFQRRSDRCMIRLTQNMGGGKTHCMIALGLLAQKPVLRYKLFGEKYSSVDDVNIVAYTGRESDIKYGIWGEIARQLGKEAFFSDFYSPLQAPGQTAWVNLLRSEKPTLILLDELPPYLEDARTKSVGTGTLADVTVTALSNLFTAVAKPELGNVLVVISDLRSNYERGNELVEAAFNNLINEENRLTFKVEPVNRANDDLFNILKCKCFESLPEEGSTDIAEIAAAYKTELSKARQSGATTSSPDSLYSGILTSYPFHPSIKELFGRFKENPNFQQTRGFIRLVRHIVRCLWNNNSSDNKYLINAYDVDLRDQETYSFIRDIKPQLDNAISHDIVSQGNTLSMAEECDENTGSRLTENTAKLILMSSLANVPRATLGLTSSDMAAFMASPTLSVSGIKTVIEKFKSKAWYLYVDDERIFFKETKNITAEIVSRKNGYTIENAKIYIRKELEKRFSPRQKDVYQQVLPFPAIDEITLSKDMVTLILFEPNVLGSGLQNDLKTWYDSQEYKNRVCFLSGQRNGMQNLYDTAREALAIDSIIDNLKTVDHVAENDPQLKIAKETKDRTLLSFLSALKEIFVTLYYPSRDGLKSYQIDMSFDSNQFVPEDQIRNLLLNTVKKFIVLNSADAIADDMFRKKLEARIFTTQKMSWSDIETRAASESSWNWYKPSTLSEAKNRYIRNGYWIESNGIVDKNPPKPKTDVNVRVLARDGSKVTLQITPINGNTVYYDVGQKATTASLQINTPQLGAFVTEENRISFLCVDSTGNNETGEPKNWDNICTCQYRVYDQHGSKMCELATGGKNLEIHYTLDGSSPKSKDSAIYKAAITLPRGNIILQAVTYDPTNNIWGEILYQRIENNLHQGENPAFRIDKNRPLNLIGVQLSSGSAREMFDDLLMLQNCEAELNSINVDIEVDGSWVSFSCGGKYITADKAREFVDSISTYFPEDRQLSANLIVQDIRFPSGSRFESWVTAKKKQISDFTKYVKQD